MDEDLRRLPAGLPTIEGEYPLRAEQVAAFHRDGHVFLPGVLTGDEVQTYRAVWRTVVARHFPDPPPLEKRSLFFRAFLSVTNTFLGDPETRPFIYSPRLGKLAADLIGAEGVRVYHNQTFFKEPGGGPTPWHQDHHYWDIDTPHMVTLWIALVDITPEMGALRFATGSHRYPFLDDQGITETAMEDFDRFIAAEGLPVVTRSMRAGDATAHHGWMLHSAQGNSSDRTREVAAVSYYPDGARLMPAPLSRARESDRKALHPDLEPGDLAVGQTTVLTYRRP